jgi:hypothetical protein
MGKFVSASKQRLLDAAATPAPTPAPKVEKKAKKAKKVKS